jgi:hypothetical protein
MTIIGQSEARPADGLAVDFVVESDHAQLSEIVQRVRDGRRDIFSSHNMLGRFVSAGMELSRKSRTRSNRPAAA